MHFRSDSQKTTSRPVALFSPGTTTKASPRSVRRRTPAPRGVNRPDRSTIPVRNSSAHRSRIPDPHIPAGRSLPIAVHSAFDVPGSIRTDSIAPGYARMPQPTSPPSKAGPAEEEQAIRQSRFPSTTSPFVPTSKSRLTSSRRCIPEARMPATTSPPTNPPRDGKIRHMARDVAGPVPRDSPVAGGYSFRTGWYGGRRIGEGEIPYRKWEMTVFPAATTSVISPNAGEASRSRRTRPSTPERRRPRRSSNPAAVSSANTTREMRSSPHAICGLSAVPRDRTVPSERSTSVPARVLVPRSSASPSDAPPDVERDRGRNGSSPAMSVPSRYAASRAGRLPGRIVTVTSPSVGKQRHARRIPEAISARVRAPGSSPPRVPPVTMTRHFPHRLSPPQGERSGTPPRTAWARMDSPGTKGTSIPSGWKRIAPGPSTMRGEEGHGREAAQGRREGGRLLRADEDAPPGQLLDPAREARDHAGEAEGPVADLLPDPALGEHLRDRLPGELPGGPRGQYGHAVDVGDQEVRRDLCRLHVPTDGEVGEGEIGGDEDGRRFARRPDRIDARFDLDRPLRVGVQVLPQREKRKKVRRVRGVQHEERAVFRHEERGGEERVREPPAEVERRGVREVAVPGEDRQPSQIRGKGHRFPGRLGGGVGDQRGRPGGARVGQRHRESLDPPGPHPQGEFPFRGELRRGNEVLRRGREERKGCRYRLHRRGERFRRGEEYEWESRRLERCGGGAGVPAGVSRDAAECDEVDGDPLSDPLEREAPDRREPGSELRVRRVVPDRDGERRRVVEGLLVPEEDRLVAEDDLALPGSDRHPRQRRGGGRRQRPLRLFRGGRAEIDRRLPGGDLHREGQARRLAALPAVGLRQQLVDVDRGQRHAAPDRRATLEGWRQTSRSAPAARHASPVVSSHRSPRAPTSPQVPSDASVASRAFHASPRWQRTGWASAASPERPARRIRSTMEKVYSIP